MKTLFLLIVLTQNGAGDINASLVNAETLQQCQQKAQMLEGVFTASNIPVIESRCLPSELKFSEFEHAAAASMIRNFYLIGFENDAVLIKKMPDWKTCKTRAQQVTELGRAYCASSVQSLYQ